LLHSGKIESLTLARKPVEIKSPILLVVKCQSAAGHWPLAKVFAAATWTFLAITGTSDFRIVNFQNSNPQSFKHQHKYKLEMHGKAQHIARSVPQCRP